VKHAETHPTLDVDGCFGCRIANIRMGTNSTTTRGKEVEQTNKVERNWQKDMPAYKRLRREGLQPKRIDGAAEVEKKAEHKWQVETGVCANEITSMATQRRQESRRWIKRHRPSFVQRWHLKSPSESR
jgi:hypothetical protein